MLKLTSFLLGYDYAVVKKQTIASKQKITKLGMLLMLPVFIWATSTYLLSYKLMELSLLVSCIVAVVCSFAIYILDRTFVTTDGDTKSNSMKYVRFSIAVISALIGSIALELSVFETDIANYKAMQLPILKEEARAEFLAENESRLAQGRADEIIQRDLHFEFLGKYQDEMQGKGSSQSGYGIRAKKLEEDANQAKRDYEKLRVENSIKEKQLDEEAEVFATDATGIDQAGIIDSVKDFHHYVFSDVYSAIVYVLFMVFLLFLEIMVLIYKSKAAPTSFENMLIAQERINNRELESFRLTREKYLDTCETIGSENYAEINRQSARPLRKVI